MNAPPLNSPERTFTPTRHNYALRNTQSVITSTNNIGSLNTNVGNVSHRYNHTINLGQGKGTLPIQTSDRQDLGKL